VETWVNSAGTSGDTGDGGAAISATLSSPEAVALYGDQLLLVASAGASVIRAIDLTTRIITRWAGTGTASSTGDGLDKLSATFNGPAGLAVLPNGDVLVTQYTACRVTRITAAGIVRPFAGTGTCSSTGDGSSALSATVNNPVFVAVGSPDAATNVTQVFVADNAGQRVRPLHLCGNHGRQEGGDFAVSVVSQQHAWLVIAHCPSCASCHTCLTRFMSLPRPRFTGARGAVGARRLHVWPHLAHRHRHADAHPVGQPHSVGHNHAVAVPIHQPRVVLQHPHRSGHGHSLVDG
jgi:hypothetical protein